MLPRETPRSICEDAERWERALTGGVPIPLKEASASYVADEAPTAEYIGSLIRELDEKEIKIIIQGGRPVLTGQVARLTEETVKAFRRYRPFILEAYGDRLEDSPVPLPKSGRRVEWIGATYPENSADWGYDEGERIGLYDWVRWRYVGARIWHARSGHIWEV